MPGLGVTDPADLEAQARAAARARRDDLTPGGRVPTPPLSHRRPRRRRLPAAPTLLVRRRAARTTSKNSRPLRRHRGRRTRPTACTWSSAPTLTLASPSSPPASCAPPPRRRRSPRCRADASRRRIISIRCSAVDPTNPSSWTNAMKMALNASPVGRYSLGNPPSRPISPAVWRAFPCATPRSSRRFDLPWLASMMGAARRP